MPSSNILARRPLAALAVTLAAASLSPGAVRAEGPCAVTQITSSPAWGSLVDDVSSNGRWLTLESQADLTGGNPDHNFEIFRYNRLTGTFLQVTDTAGHANVASEISDDGGRISFRSTSDPGIFVHDVAAGETQEVVAEDVGAASMDGGGDRFVFLANDDFTGQNPDGNSEVFLFDRIGDRFVQVTDSVFLPCPFPTLCSRNFSPWISKDSSAVVFASDYGYAGATGPSVYVFDTAAETLEPVAAITTGAGFPTAISGDGSRVAYVDAGGRLAVHDRPSASTMTSAIAGIRRPQGLDREGRRVLLHDRDLGGLVLAFDPDSGTETQLTASGSDLFLSRISGAGSVVATSANADWTGQNPALQFQVFVLSCPPSSPLAIDIPVLQPAGLLVLILALGGGAVLALRRRHSGG